jgi:hypothetical protein
MEDLKMETYGDLKKIINRIKLKQKSGKIISQGKSFILDQALGLIPGASNAKTTFEFLKAAFEKPDTKKTQTWLDKLDIDDDMSAIIDDTVENGFLKMMADTIESEPDDKPLESDFNMNAKMVGYLKDKYNQRTVTGISERKMKYKLVKKVNEVGAKIPSSIVTISKDLADQGSNFKQINTKDKMVQLFDAMVNKIKENNPDFVGSSTFKQALVVIYNKYK